jgi:hypothetical protein
VRGIEQRCAALAGNEMLPCGQHDNGWQRYDNGWQ